MAHTRPEYMTQVNRMFNSANRLADAIVSHDRGKARGIMEFMVQHGYMGIPGTTAGRFNLGCWLAASRPGAPNQQAEGIAVIPCFSDDIPPVKRPQTTTGYQWGGCYSRTAQAITIFDTERLTDTEIGLLLLHEGAHARHRTRDIAGLPPLDPDDIHETNTWAMMLNCVTAIGGDAWSTAIAKEIRWLEAQNPDQPRPRAITYTWGSPYCLELDAVFGPVLHSSIKRFRQELLATAGNMLYWESRTRLGAEDILHSIVTAHYPGL
ncbi:hypothetical protein CL628_01360 [bacterium]|nr:hypothetical protein [bacterium]